MANCTGRPVPQLIRCEDGWLLASGLIPRSPPRLNLSGTVSPATKVLVLGRFDTGAAKPVPGAEHCGGTSNDSVLSSRLVVPWVALAPRPRRAKDDHTMQAFSPPVSAWSAAMMASRPTTKPGPQPWNFRPSITSCWARLFPPVFHGSQTLGLNPCTSIRFHVMSHRIEAQPWPMPCGIDSDPPVIQEFVLIRSYVNGWISMSREYGAGRMPGLCRPSSCHIITDGITIPGSVPPMVIGAPATLLATIIAVAPAAWALFAFSTNVHVPRSTRAIAPAGNPTRGSQPSVVVSVPSSTRTTSPLMPVSSGAGPKLAPVAR